MASKRKVKIEGQEQGASEPDDGELPLWLDEQPWRVWFVRVFASRLYALACFAFDVFLGLELYRALGSELVWLVLPVLALAVALQVTIYLYLWGSKGRLRS